MAEPSFPRRSAFWFLSFGVCMTYRSSVQAIHKKIWYVLFVAILFCGLYQDIPFTPTCHSGSDIHLTTLSIDFGPQPLLELRASPRLDNSKNRQSDGLPPLTCVLLYLSTCHPCDMDSPLHKDDIFFIPPSQMKDWPPLPLAPPLA